MPSKLLTTCLKSGIIISVLFNYEGINNMKNIFKKVFGAFTMAEILLSLTIIGVVAAITLPSLTGNINERTWATQKKALYARMSQAFPLLDSINTHGDAESFIAGALNTVTKINNVCGAANIEDCGISSAAIATMNGDIMTEFPLTWTSLTGNNGSGAGASSSLTAAFETGNGESVVLYYNPGCMPDQELAPGGSESILNYICVNMMYDLNNSKGPNAVGKDIGFITVFYPMDSVVVAPVPDVNSSLSTTCSSDDYRWPNKFEAASMAINNKFLSNSVSGNATFGSSTKGATSSSTYRYYVSNNMFISTPSLSGNAAKTRCVKR